MMDGGGTSTCIFGGWGGGGGKIYFRGEKVTNAFELKERLNILFRSLNWLVLCEIEENHAKRAQICCFRLK